LAPFSFLPFYRSSTTTVFFFNPALFLPPQFFYLVFFFAFFVIIIMGILGLMVCYRGSGSDRIVLAFFFNWLALFFCKFWRVM